MKIRPWHLYGLIAVLAAVAVVEAVDSRPLSPRTIVAFGDSYFSGYGMDDAGDSFPSQLERALRKRGHNARVVNEGADGETIADGLMRLDRTIAAKPDLIILELGENDAEQGIDPEISRANLDTMLTRIRAAHIRVVLCGAIAPVEAGEIYQAAFDPIYPAMAAKYQVPLYHFILDGVASETELIQDDGEHPNPKGVQVMVDRILPVIEKNFR